MGLSFWIWSCDKPDCEGGSNKPLSRIHARRSGIRHMQYAHNDYEAEPILTKVSIPQQQDRKVYQVVRIYMFRGIRVNDNKTNKRNELIKECILYITLMFVGTTIYCLLLTIINIPSTKMIFMFMIALLVIDIPKKYYKRWRNCIGIQKQQKN